MPEGTVDDGPGEYPRVSVPLEAWRHVLRRVRQLEQLHKQAGVIVGSLVEAVEAVPADEAGNQT